MNQPIVRRCPSFLRSEAGKSEAVCQETGLPPALARNPQPDSWTRCPIIGSTNGQCEITGTLPSGFVAKLRERLAERQKIKRLGKPES